MINNNKILTVSYGTFSCTLEGFDDSFGTMKAIAEYFRDLSADDRYFGAEPAQPDAQMLARIAERETSRQVEARQDRGRIVLSAQSGQSVPNDKAATVAADAVDDVADAMAEAVMAKPDNGGAEAQADADVAPQNAKQNDGAQVEQDMPTARTEPAPTEQGATDTGKTPAPTDTPSKDATARDIVPSLPDEDVEAFFSEKQSTSQAGSSDAMFEAVDDDADALDKERAKAESIAEKLKRIRAVVSQQGDTAKSTGYAEDQHADAAAAPDAELARSVADADAEAATDEEDTSNDVLAATLRDIEDALETDDAHEDTGTSKVQRDGAAVAEADEESEEDDIAAILSRLEREADLEPEGDDTSGDDDTPDNDHRSADTSGPDEDEVEDDDMDSNILAAMDTVEAGHDDAEHGDAATDDDNLFEDSQKTAEKAKKDIQTPPPAPAAQSKPASPRTRVLKVKRTTLEAAIKSGKLEEYDTDDDAKNDAPVRKAPLAARSTLSDEAEEALARELAELEADMKAGQDAPEEAAPAKAAQADTQASADTAPAADTTQSRGGISKPADDDISRLMEESEHQMEEPEAATRRDAFAHLRAAVAAKKADEAVGGSDSDAESDGAYRDDLASVVRPRRPVSGGERPRTERPAETRPAPLKLVAEQRIDVGERAPNAPVRPRRVAAVAPQTAPASEDTADSFVDFADEMGATKLPDLLEAAAAYLSFVEGRDEFSRPQLMTKVRQVEKENFTREDSLRSFGQLLREGKIEKLRGGRFQASDQIGFKPAKRAAG